MANTPGLISVVVRTLNEGRYIGHLFDALEAQAGTSGALEILVVDSGSTDETVAIARARGARVLEIPRETFHYSGALNLGIASTSGAVVVILSAHAIPCSTDWLAVMLSHFSDPRVVGVFSRQRPWPGAQWREVVRLAGMFGNESRRFDGTDAAGDIPFSNAASCIRRTMWMEQHFHLPAAEDTEWATGAVRAGHAVVYRAAGCRLPLTRRNVARVREASHQPREGGRHPARTQAPRPPHRKAGGGCRRARRRCDSRLHGRHRSRCRPALGVAAAQLLVRQGLCAMRARTDGSVTP